MDSRHGGQQQEPRRVQNPATLPIRFGRGTLSKFPETEEHTVRYLYLFQTTTLAMIVLRIVAVHLGAV